MRTTPIVWRDDQFEYRGTIIASRPRTVDVIASPKELRFIAIVDGDVQIATKDVQKIAITQTAPPEIDIGAPTKLERQLRRVARVYGGLIAMAALGITIACATTAEPDGRVTTAAISFAIFGALPAWLVYRHQIKRVAIVRTLVASGHSFEAHIAAKTALLGARNVTIGWIADGRQWKSEIQPFADAATAIQVIAAPKIKHVLVSYNGELFMGTKIKGKGAALLTAPPARAA